MKGEAAGIDVPLPIGGFVERWMGLPYPQRKGTSKQFR